MQGRLVLLSSKTTEMPKGTWPTQRTADSHTYRKKSMSSYSFSQGTLAISCNKYSSFQTCIEKAYQVQPSHRFAASPTSKSHNLFSGDQDRSAQENGKTIAAFFLRRGKPPILLSRALAGKSKPGLRGWKRLLEESTTQILQTPHYLIPFLV